MRTAVALVAAMVLAGCSAGQRREDDAITVTQADHDYVGNARPPVAANAGPLPVAAPTPAPPAVPAAAAGLEAPMPVRGEFTEQPLPPELAHLNGLGATGSQAAARKEGTP